MALSLLYIFHLLHGNCLFLIQGQQMFHIYEAHLFPLFTFQDVDTIYLTQDTRELNLQDFSHLENRWEFEVTEIKYNQNVKKKSCGKQDEPVWLKTSNGIGDTQN